MTESTNSVLTDLRAALKADSVSNSVPSLSPKMTVKKVSTLATRGLDSFLLFNDKKFVSGYQNLVTIQPLNKSKIRGWFIRNSDLDTCGWNATENDFDKGSVNWNYKQTFGIAPNTSIEEGLNFTEPRLQILLRSPLMVEETMGMRQTIGTFDDPDVKALFEADKIASDLANSKGEMYKRKYSVRTKYLVYILKNDNTRAHKIPMVLTLKGLNGTDAAEKIRLYEKEMSKCLSKALDSEVPLAFNEKFFATTVFTPVLANEMRGANNVEICAIESFSIPDYSTQEAAIQSLNAMSIPDEDRESTWKFQEMYQDYIMQHSKQDAEKLGGAYGVKAGVEILPETRGSAVDVKALHARNPITGEDDSL
jgi:Family of unknown function (DUF5895)